MIASLKVGYWPSGPPTFMSPKRPVGKSGVGLNKLNEFGRRKPGARPVDQSNRELLACVPIAIKAAAKVINIVLKRLRNRPKARFRSTFIVSAPARSNSVEQSVKAQQNAPFRRFEGMRPAAFNPVVQRVLVDPG